MLSLTLSVPNMKRTYFRRKCNWNPTIHSHPPKKVENTGSFVYKRTPLSFGAPKNCLKVPPLTQLWLIYVSFFIFSKGAKMIRQGPTDNWVIDLRHVNGPLALNCTLEILLWCDVRFQVFQTHAEPHICHHGGDALLPLRRFSQQNSSTKKQLLSFC